MIYTLLNGGDRMDREDKYVVGAVIAAVVGYYVGGYTGFFPFLVGDIVVQEIGYCTMIICGVIGFCTRAVLRSINRRQGDGLSEDKGEDGGPAEDK